ncbi:MAG: amidohydrolase family protein [Cyanobacteria bacterium J06592_8]
MIDLWDIPAIDHHAHNLLTVEAAQELPYVAAFTEGYEDENILNHHARHSLFYRRSIRDIAQLLDCEPTEEAIVLARQNLGLEKLTQICLHAAKLEGLFLDDGFLTDQILPWSWHQQYIPTQKILRLEELAENLLNQTSKFETFLDLFLEAIDPPPPEVIAFKSIAAYRTGLDIQITPIDFAKSHFVLIKKSSNNSSTRLTDKPLIDFLITEALQVAAKYKLPVQFHTGFGDPDLDLFVGNPVLLRPLLEEETWRDAPIVLLHASYPYTREAGYLASVYPQVYLDFGLAVPFLSVMGMRSTLRQLLELSPTTKLMYSSDAHNLPELYYLGAKWGREILQQVLEQSIEDADLTDSEADDIARAMLSENAKGLYLKADPQKLE